MAGKKNPNLGDKLRQEREGAENTLRDSRSKTADSSTGDGGKKKAEHRRQIRHEADLAKMRSKKLKSDQEVKAKKNAAASGKKGGKPKKPGNLAADALSAKAHQSVRNADQDNNSGVEAAHFTEGSAEGAARAGSRFQYGRKLRQYKKLERLEKKANKDAVDSIFAERMKSDPQAGSNLFSRWRQKQAIKKEYAAAKAGAAAAENTASGTAKAAQGTVSITEKAFQFVQSHSHIIIGIAAVGLLVLVIAGSVSSCSVLINGGGNVVLGTSYTAEDEDLKSVETDYTKLEDKLRKQIDRIETDHPGYDEYRYNLAEIGHNPYELASLLTVEFENYTRSQVQARLQSIFEAQYKLKLEEKVEIRTRKETRVGYRYNPITGTGHTYTYQVTVQYEYKILNVKTEDGKYISAYACDAKTCDEEFLLSKRQYEHITGRTQAHDVIAYQIRQSFKPGEITPEEANKVGYETAMRFTKGKHAFIVATHVDRAHIHNHIIFNSTTLDCTRKFRDFRLSGLALARLSDIVCLEHRLSVIVRKPYGERKKRTEYPEKKSQRDEICEAIDAALERKPKDFQELIGILQEAGYEYKDGKQPALRGKGHARFARFRSLGKGYSVEELCGVIAGNAVHKSKFAEKTRTSARSAQVHQKAELSFLIDVRAKMQAGKGAGYARWAKVFNLKQMAKAMMFMEEHGIKSYAELKEKADEISEKCDALLESVKADEARMSEVSVLRKHLINYAKTKDVFAAYKASGYNQEFYEAHRDTLALRSAAKKAFDAYKKENGSDKKLPRISELNAEYAMLLERKKSSYAEYRKTKSEMQDWLVAQKIVQEILKENEQKKEQLHEQEVRQEEENKENSR